MFLNDWSKLRIASLSFLFLIFSVSMQTLPASAQDAFSDLSSGPTLVGRGEISGMVYSDTGSPAARVTVTIESLSGEIFRSVLSDFDGRFHVRGLPAGAYKITANAKDYSPDELITRVSGLTSDVSLRLKSIRSNPTNGSSVSVRELKIPEKALNEYKRGLARLAKQDPAGGLEHFHKAAAIFPDYYEALYSIGVAELLLGNVEEAMQDFQRTIEVSGGRYAMAQFAYGLLLCNRGKPEEAERIIRSGLETDSNPPEGHFFLGVCLYALNRFEEAEASLRAALLRKPDFADIYLVLADVHAKRNDRHAQLQDLDMFLKLAPSSPRAERIRKIREAVQRLVAQAGSEVPATSASNVSE